VSDVLAFLGANHSESCRYKEDIYCTFATELYWSMPYVSLLVGQCGNQLGSATLEEVAANCEADLSRLQSPTIDYCYSLTNSTVSSESRVQG
jgi:hypothetical protein